MSAASSVRRLDLDSRLQLGKDDMKGLLGRLNLKDTMYAICLTMYSVKLLGGLQERVRARGEEAGRKDLDKLFCT